MEKWPFKENPEALIVICKHLQGGAKLHWVHHVPKEEHVWQLTCAEEHQSSDMNKITLAEASKLFPEIIELADVPEDMSVSFKRGINSGKWYDFHHS
jgi:hypothetical protein